MKFASAFDEALYTSGPPACFTLDPRGHLRVDPERTREIYLLHRIEGREIGHYVLTDAVTGLRLYLLVTHPLFATAQPRGTVERHPDHTSATLAAAEQWAVPVADPGRAPGDEAGDVGD